MKRIPKLALLAASLFLIASVDANAEIRVRCEKRADRSVVSVDGSNLAPGVYSAQVISGTNQKTSPEANSIGDQAEFDFSSQPKDIAAGAIAIGKAFIQGQVTGKILNAQGATVISDTVKCRTK